MTAARENETRRDFSKAWRIESEHFTVKTNHSLERGAEISRKLEIYYEFFHNTFHDFFTTPQQMALQFEGKMSHRNNHHEVHYYRDKQEYVNRLKRKIPQYYLDENGRRIPQISITNGLYYTPSRTSYFFYDPDPKADNDSTLYHEATHQLFFEPTHPAKRFSRAVPHYVGNKRFFWAVEGIACYMESVLVNEGTLSIGNVDAKRFYQARYRLLNDGYYVPLQRLSGMGMEEFKAQPHIAKNYSQTAGLSQFFMHYKQGKYRAAFIAHLTQLYALQGQQADFVQSLAELTGVPYDELDQQYSIFMKQMEEEAKGKIPTDITVPVAE